MSDSAVFLDSNVCLYLLSEDSPKKVAAEQLLALPKTVISSQVIGETINVGIKKFAIIFSFYDSLMLPPRLKATAPHYIQKICSTAKSLMAN